jgi:nondiscriminating glutamyl-tRNA synthetase
MSVRVRFAPSPTGQLHVGNVRTALFNWLFAKQNNGDFILRIEDTDIERSQPGSEERIKQDLLWLGLSWNEGIDQGGDRGPYRQTDRLAIYADYASKLRSSGAAYPCFCSRRELERVRRDQLSGGKSHYPGTCRTLPPSEVAKRQAKGQPSVLRFLVRKGPIGFEDLIFGRLGIDCREIGDFVLLRSDGTPQYNFASVIDDHCMEISHVIRGEGHISNTYRQLLVYEALQMSPPHFAHLSTILGPDGKILSKRHGAKSISALQSEGYLPEAILNYLSLLGWTPPKDGKEILKILHLTEQFTFKRVHRNPAIFDEEKLNWVNRNHLKICGNSCLVDLLLPFLTAQGWVPDNPDTATRAWLETLSSALLKYLERGSDIVPAAAFLFESPSFLSDNALQILHDPACQRVIRVFRDALGDNDEPITPKLFEATLHAVKSETGARGKTLFHPIRLALTSKTSGLDLPTIVELVESGRSLRLPKPIRGVADRIQGVMDLIL